MIRKKENVIISTVDMRIVSEHLQQQQHLLELMILSFYNQTNSIKSSNLKSLFSFNNKKNIYNYHVLKLSEYICESS